MRYLRRFVCACSGLARDRRGQFAIPFLFVLPSLFLFVYLIYETTKLSREKIRHQFAADSAAFTEMTVYADFLNRSAYINGAFPQRVFRKAYSDICFEPKSITEVPHELRENCGNRASLYRILYENGAFPIDENIEEDFFQEGGMTDYQWNTETAVKKIQFHERAGDELNDASPTLQEELVLFTKADADTYWITWDDAQDAYRLYVQLYQLLGSVEDAQYSVFCRLTGAPGCPSASRTHNLFRKSYWLNTNAPVEDAYEGAQGFDLFTFKPEPHCITKMQLYGNRPTTYAFRAFEVAKTEVPIPMPDTIKDCSGGPGLFQMITIPSDQIRNMQIAAGSGVYPGYPVIQHFDTDEAMLSRNYFKVNFHEQVPGGIHVHSTAALLHPSGEGSGLWPDPAPNFTTKLYP